MLTVIISVFFVQKIEKWDILKRILIELLDIKTTVCEIKDGLEIDVTEGKKIVNLKLAVQVIQSETAGRGY